MWRQISVQGIEGAKVRRKALAPQAERRPPRHAGNTGGRPRIAEIRGRGGARRPGCPPVRCAAGSRRRRSRRLHELQQPRPEPGRKPSARRSWAKCRDSRSARSATQLRGRVARPPLRGNPSDCVVGSSNQVGRRVVLVELAQREATERAPVPRRLMMQLACLHVAIFPRPQRLRPVWKAPKCPICANFPKTKVRVPILK